MARGPALPAAFLAAPIAHRGLHGPGTPENSAAACVAAARAGYGIEIDVQRAACGTPVVFHDATLERMTAEGGPVAGLDAEALARLPLAGTAETIPTLADILAALAPDVPLLVEVKEQATAAATRALAEATAALLAERPGPTALMSFAPDAVAAAAAATPGLPRGLTTCTFEAADWPHLDAAERARRAALDELLPLGCGFASHDRRTLDHPPLAALRAAGLPLLSWTIRSAEEERAARTRSDNVTFEGYRPPVPAH